MQFSIQRSTRREDRRGFALEPCFLGQTQVMLELVFDGIGEMARRVFDAA
jgi:hypothetical protein